MISTRDRTTLRNYACRLAEYASNPRYQQLSDQWIRHNRLEPGKPMVVVFPEGAWREILPQSALTCTSIEAREIEWALRARIYHAEHFRDDTVIDANWTVHAAYRADGWGLEPEYVHSSDEHGAWGFSPPLRDAEEDFHKLRFPTLVTDEDASVQKYNEAQELFGDILTVTLTRNSWLDCSLIGHFTRLRGLDQLMLDMCDRPEWVHQLMTFLCEGVEGLMVQAESLGAIALNNGNDYVGSGGFGWSDELPVAGYQGRPRLRDRWGMAEAQELAQVSPGMLDEFVLPYQARLLERFGLNCYGCCEDITRKLPMIIARIPRLRRISVSPWTDRGIAAEILGDRYIYSWKPNPAEMMVTYDQTLIRQVTEETLTMAEGAILEMILKDTHTVMHQPQRIESWIDIAQACVDDSA